MAEKKAKGKSAEDPRPLTTAQRLDVIGEEAIFARIADCEFIHVIAESYGMSAGSLHAWLDLHPEAYARARERQADRLVADMLQIADEAKRDTYVDEQGNVRTDQEVVARSRLRVDARKWLAGKMHSGKYGDRTIHAGDEKAPLRSVVEFVSPEQALAEIAAAVQIPKKP